MTQQKQKQPDLELDLDLPPAPAPRAARPRPLRRGAPTCGHPAATWQPAGGPACRCTACCGADVGALLHTAGRLIAAAGRAPKLTGTPAAVRAAGDARRQLLDPVERIVEETTAALFDREGEPATQTRLRIVADRGLLRRAIAIRAPEAGWWIAQTELPAVAGLPHATGAEIILDAELAAALSEAAAHGELHRQAKSVIARARQHPGLAKREALDAVGRTWAAARGRGDA